MPVALGISYTVCENGPVYLPPILLLHDAGASQAIWPVGLRRLTGRRVYSLDLPGHGRSGGASMQTVSGYSQALQGWLHAVGLYQVVLAGHGLGGAIALDFAARNPDQAVALALWSSGAAFDVPSSVLDHLSTTETAPLALAELSGRAFAPGASPAHQESCLAHLRQVRPSVLLSDWRALHSFDLRAQVYRVTAPVWVACGTEDRLTPVSASHFLAGQLPQARLTLIGGAGHFLPAEHPEALAAGLLALVSGGEVPASLPRPETAPAQQAAEQRSRRA